MTPDEQANRAVKELGTQTLAAIRAGDTDKLQRVRLVAAGLASQFEDVAELARGGIVGLALREADR